MIDDKAEIPSEYVSIRQIWIKGIEDCRRAISQVANIETSSERKDWMSAGPRTVVHTVDALYLSLVNYGEALILDDVEKYREEVYLPKLDALWGRKKKPKKQQPVQLSMLADDDDEEEDGKQVGVETLWWENFKLSKAFYKEIIAVLQKYNMLFPEPYRGFSNVEMTSVE